MGNEIWASVSVPGALANPGARYICCCNQASSTGNPGGSATDSVREELSLQPHSLMHLMKSREVTDGRKHSGETETVR